MAEAVDGGGHLVDEGVVLVHIGGLHHAHHGVVLASHHAVVAGGVGQHGGEQRGRGAGAAMVADQGGEGGRAHQWRVAGKHHDVAVGVDERRREEQ